MNVYIDSANFSTATTVYLDSLLSEVAPDGYYSSQGYYRRQVDGRLTDTIKCATIDTVSVTSIGETTATFNGELINNGGDVNAIRGFVYDTSPNPTTANSVVTAFVNGAGAYSLNVNLLTSGVTYYVRAYSIVFGNTIYGDELSFTTLGSLVACYRVRGGLDIVPCSDGYDSFAAIGSNTFVVGDIVQYVRTVDFENVICGEIISTTELQDPDSYIYSPTTVDVCGDPIYCNIPNPG
jgi:hypothetical protein